LGRRLDYGKRSPERYGNYFGKNDAHGDTCSIESERRNFGAKGFRKRDEGIPETDDATLTYDQRKEMSEHRLFTKDTEIKVFFCHPSSQWERGTNENTNGLIRQFFPKGTDFN